MRSGSATISRAVPLIVRRTLFMPSSPFFRSMRTWPPSGGGAGTFALPRGRAKRRVSRCVGTPSRDPTDATATDRVFRSERDDSRPTETPESLQTLSIAARERIILGCPQNVLRSCTARSPTVFVRTSSPDVCSAESGCRPCGSWRGSAGALRVRCRTPSASCRRRASSRATRVVVRELIFPTARTLHRRGAAASPGRSGTQGGSIPAGSADGRSLGRRDRIRRAPGRRSLAERRTSASERARATAALCW